MAAGFFGFLRSRLNWLLRLIYLAVGGLLLAPSNQLLIMGSVMAAIGIAIESLLMRRQALVKS